MLQAMYYLHEIKVELDKILKRENKSLMAEKCFEFLKHVLI